MPRFFFDRREDEACTFDDRGVVLTDIQAARDHATQVLAAFARRVSPSATRRVIGIEVRDEAKHPVLEARLILEPVRPG
jgi:hypothetical protein